MIKGKQKPKMGCEWQKTKEFSEAKGMNIITKQERRKTLRSGASCCHVQFSMPCERNESRFIQGNPDGILI